MPRITAIALIAAALAAGVAACGGGGDETTTSGTETAAANQGTIKLADGRITIPAQNVGDVDLTKLPLGDDRVGTTPGKGLLDVCNTQTGGAPGGTTLPDWVHGDTFNLKQKLVVAGSVNWPKAEFTNTVQGDTRVLKGNDLPTSYDTGTFPVESDDPAYAFEPDPLSIVANDYEFDLPAEPTPASAPNCVGNEVGVLLSGVVLFDAVDANLHDAIAREVEDACEGHPNNAGYHHHWISTCLDDSGTGQSPVLGFAFDGYPITGHRGEDGQALTNDDLDECHGTTSPIELDGKTVTMYHYAATWEFPYTVGCYHGTAAVQSPALQPVEGNDAGATGAPAGAPPP